ncbi:MAG: ABC transporter ATP-binding protein [Lachnospiraceae bacterium]|nr:ABC transporter ATP-binding protein [Lachnospiraceae bacterium]
MKNHKKQDEHIFAEKLTKDADIDEDVLLESFRRNETHSLKTLIGLYKDQYFKLFLSVLMFAIKHTPVWALPIVTANIINAATVPSENAASTIIINVTVMIVLVLQNLLTNYLHTYFYAKVVRNVECGLRSSMIRKLQQLSITYHNEMQSGRLQSKIMRDVEQIENLSAQIFISVLSIALNIAVSLTIVLNSSFTVFAFFAASIPVAVLIRNVFKEKISTRNRNFRKEMEETSVKVMEMVELIPVTRAHALEETETQKLGSQLKSVAKHGFRLDMIQSFFGSVSWASFQIFQVICLGFTGWLAVQGKILPGDVVMYQTYFGTIVNQISGIVTLIPIISKGLESVNSVGDILLSADVEDTGNKKKIKKVDGKIEFKNVNFRFKNAEAPVINNLSFSINKGETVAFVGASGAGKTTLINLVIGFLRPNSGQVLIDGKDLNTINLQSYRCHISVVPQTPILFTGTIRENITYGLENMSDEFLNEVIDAANLKELIDSLPNGLDTEITEHGSNLSGGQRQRVSIARAFVRNPKILILDEATSALDTVSEKKIQDSIERLVEDRTTLIVAHRLSTIRNADKIAVIGDGGMLEFGTYDELMEKRGEFYKLRSLQF